MKQIVALLTALALALCASAQVPADSVVGRPATAIAAAGAIAIAEGAIAHTVAPQFGATTLAEPGRGSNAVADVAQYVPLVFPWAMKACGAPTRSGWGRMAVSQGFGALIMAASVEAVKRSVTSQRPDGSDWRSFPSGHTAWAFMGATATAIELSELSPWYAVGAYSFAAAVAAERIIGSRHFPADVVAGAGIGIVSAQVGYWLGDVIFGSRQLNRISDTTGAGPWQVSVATGLNFATNRCGAVRLHPALSTRLGVSRRVADGFGLGLSAELLSEQLVVDDVLQGPRNSLGVMLAPSYTVERGFWTFDATLTGGMRCRLNLDNAPAIASSGTTTAVGRLEAGAAVALSNRLGCRAAIGYELSHYSYTLASGTASSGTLGAVTASLAARISF